MKIRFIIPLVLTLAMSLFACARPAAPVLQAEPSCTPQIAALLPQATPAPVQKRQSLIVVVAQGTDTPFWQAAKAGCDNAAAQLGAQIRFDGPGAGQGIHQQVSILEDVLADHPDALVLSPLSPNAAAPVLAQYAQANIPVIGLGYDVSPATVSTDGEAAGALAAEKLGASQSLIAAMEAAGVRRPMVIGCIVRDALYAAAVDRAAGFAEGMKRISETYQPGMVSVEGHSKWESAIKSPAIIIRMTVCATADVSSAASAASALLSEKNLKAIFCSDEVTTAGLLAAVGGGAAFSHDGRYGDVAVIGFGTDAALQETVRSGHFLGALAEDPFALGYQAVALALRAAKGEDTADQRIDAVWYDAKNMDNTGIHPLLGP